MADVFAIISAAVGFSFKLEHMVHRLSDDLKEAKEFGSSLEKARLQMQWEADRMRDMRILLFGQSDQDNIISGVTFASFDKRTQLTILNILRRFSELLSLNYKIIDGRYSASEPSPSMILNPTIAFESFQHGTLVKKLRWGFRDKKKLDKVLQELQSWNDRLFARIQMSFIRLDQQESTQPQNFSRPSLLLKSRQSLNNNVEAGKLGLADDANLLRLASAPSSVQLPGMKITDFHGWMFDKERNIAGDVSRSTAHANGDLVLLEYKEYMPDLEGNPTPAVEKRVEKLANMLHSQKSDRYYTLNCRGYYLEESKQRLVFVFDIPLSDRQASITTLHQDLLTQKTPALEDRFVLAKTLAMSLSQLFTVGWVHKSFRSGNILHFRKPPALTEEDKVSISRALPNLSFLSKSLVHSKHSPVKILIGCSVAKTLSSWPRVRTPNHGGIFPTDRPR